MIYYAGHGFEIGGVNYLVPVDARLAVDKDAETEAVVLEQLLAAVGGARKLRLVILDACRDNPFARTMQRTISLKLVDKGFRDARNARPSRMSVECVTDHTTTLSLFAARVIPV